MNSGEDGVWLTVLKNRKIIFANSLCDSLWETNSSHSINITVTFLGVPGRKYLLPLSLANWCFLPNVFRCHSDLGRLPGPGFGTIHASSKPPKGHPGKVASESLYSPLPVSFYFVWYHSSKEDLKYLFFFLSFLFFGQEAGS